MMRVVNYHSIKGMDWATGMKPQMRLEATTPGLTYTKVWKQGASVNGLVQDHKYTKYWTIKSDNLKDTADWQVRVKMTWDRPWPVKDVNKEVVIPFNGGCSTGKRRGGGRPPAGWPTDNVRPLPAAPAVPLPGSGGLPTGRN